MLNRKNKLATKAKPTEIMSHWPKLIEKFQFSPQEFYLKVEKAIADRQVPGLITSRVDWKEGGALSARREYLRLTRERLIFDVCSAPFGTGFFVSIWFGQKPLRVGLLIAVCIAALLFAVYEAFFFRFGFLAVSLYRYFGLRPDTVAWSCVAVAAISFLLIIIRVGSNLDDVLIHTPVIGYFYERFFRKITLYRIDQTCMYQAAVHAAVTQVIDEITTGQGIKPLSELDRRPVFQQLVRSVGSNGRN